MKLNSKFAWGCVAALLALGLALTGCDNGTTPSGGGPPSITWTLSQTGGAFGNPPASTTTAINIDFSAAVTDLMDSHITIGGTAASRNNIPLSQNSTGTLWTVPVNVTSTETVTVSINKPGVATGQKPVLVYLAGQAPPITWNVSVNGTAGSVNSTAITFKFSDDVNLTANNINLTNGTGSVTKGTLTGSGNTWTLGITVETAGTITVAIINSPGISTTPQQVTVHKASSTGGGTGKTITITGLDSSYNGKYAEVALFSNMDQVDAYLDGDFEPTVGGGGTTTIQNGRITISLVNTANLSPWTTGGSWHVGLVIWDDNGPLYMGITDNTVSFNSDDTNVTFSTFTEFTGGGNYDSTTFGDFLLETAGYTISPNGITLDEFASILSGGDVSTWAEVLSLGFKIFKNAERTVQYLSGSERVYADTRFWFEATGGGGNYDHMTFGEYFEGSGYTIPPAGVTLNEIAVIMSGGDLSTWEEVVALGYFSDIYSDAAMTQKFLGTSRVYSDTVFYFSY
jgi:hypothetical protein